MKTTASSIEPLEARIAPASLNAAGTILTYTDIDGDAVKVTFTHGVMTPADFSFSTGNATGSTDPQRLLSIYLFEKPDGIGFTLGATPHLGKGDSHANVDSIVGISGPNAGANLGNIVVDGNVGTFNAGTGEVGTFGLKSLTALSFGQQFNNASQLSTIENASQTVFTVKGDIFNTIIAFHGGVKSLNVGGDLGAPGKSEQSEIHVTGDAGSVKIGGSLYSLSSTAPSLEITGKVGTLAIGGSVIGGTFDIATNRQVYAGSVTTLTVGGDLRGSVGNGGGSIEVNGTTSAVKIGGSLLGSAGQFTASLTLQGGAKSVSIGGSLIGAGGSASAALSSNSLLRTVKIAGSIIGGSASDTGFISARAIGSIAIGHDLVGANSPGNKTTQDNGFVSAYDGNIGTFILGGSLIAGQNLGSVPLTHNGAIEAAGIIGKLTIGGSVHGDPTHLAYIQAGGAGTSGAVNAIKTLTVKGSVHSGSILAGYDDGSAAANLDSGFGSIRIGGNLSGSFITFGSTKGGDGIPGNTDDGPSTAFIATAGSIKIGGTFSGLAGDSTRFYIEGPNIKKLIIGKATYLQPSLHGGGIEFDAVGLAHASSYA